jgi:hypothetical protein
MEIEHLQRFSRRLNQLDRVEHSQNRAPTTVTEMNFGLRSAGNGRLARYGRPGQGSTYLSTVTEMNFGLRSAGNGRLARHGRPGQGSTYLSTVTEMNFGLRSAGNGRLARYGRPGQGSTYLSTVTEMNFGLRSAGNGRLARHGRPGQGSTYLRTAMSRYAARAVGLMLAPRYPSPVPRFGTGMRRIARRRAVVLPCFA